MISYLDSIDGSRRINTIKTDEKGIAETSIPISLKDQWAIQTDHKFIAVTTATKGQESTTTELPPLLPVVGQRSATAPARRAAPRR